LIRNRSAVSYSAPA